MKDNLFVVLMKRNIWILLVNIALISCADYRRDKNVAEVLMLEDKEAYAEAITLLTEMLEEDPDNVYMLYERAKLQMRGKNYAAALPDLNRAIEGVNKNPTEYWSSSMFTSPVNTGAVYSQRAELFYAMDSLIPALLDYENCIYTFQIRNPTVSVAQMTTALKRRDEIYNEIRGAAVLYEGLVHRIQNKTISHTKDPVTVHVNNCLVNNYLMNNGFDSIKFSGAVWQMTKRRYNIGYIEKNNSYKLDSTLVFIENYDFDRNKQLCFSSFE